MGRVNVLTFCGLVAVLILGSCPVTSGESSGSVFLNPEIQKINTEMDSVTVALDRIDKELTKIKGRFDEISRQKKNLLTRIASVRAKMLRDLTTLYGLYVMEQSLEEQNVSVGPLLWKVGLVKVSILSKSRALDREYQQALEMLDKVRTALRSEQRELQKAKELYQRKLASLRCLRDNKLKLLAKLHKDGKTGVVEFPKVDKWTKSTHSVSPEYKGKLKLPVNGVIERVFVEKKGSVLARFLYNKGVFIKAPVGTKVKAVADGKVAYAGWFREFGRVVIIDHGAHFFSVTAYLGKVTKKTGDVVLKGEVVGEVGSPELTRCSGIYFEWRRHGKPLPVFDWFVMPDGKNIKRS